MIALLAPRVRPAASPSFSGDNGLRVLAPLVVLALAAAVVIAACAAADWDPDASPSRAGPSTAGLVVSGSFVIRMSSCRRNSSICSSASAAAVAAATSTVAACIDISIAPCNCTTSDDSIVGAWFPAPLAVDEDVISGRPDLSIASRTAKSSVVSNSAPASAAAFRIVSSPSSVSYSCCSHGRRQLRSVVLFAPRLRRFHLSCCSRRRYRRITHRPGLFWIKSRWPRNNLGIGPVRWFLFTSCCSSLRKRDNRIARLITLYWIT
jgi:hypothetical protein